MTLSHYHDLNRAKESESVCQMVQHSFQALSEASGSKSLRKI
jgi:hypothetical protein